MSGPKNAILDRWGSTALRPVELPSGMKALVKLPDVQDLVLRDALPASLRELAFKYASSGIDVSKLEADDLKRFVQFTHELIARSLRYLAPPESEAWDRFRTEGVDPTAEGWEPITLTAAQIADMDVDPSDLEALAAIVGRQKTTNEVTALARFDRGLLGSEALVEAAAAEGDRVSDFATFRRQSERPDDRPDGEDVRPAAERPSASGRPGRRVRSRRSDRP